MRTVGLLTTIVAAGVAAVAAVGFDVAPEYV